MKEIKQCKTCRYIQKVARSSTEHECRLNPPTVEQFSGKGAWPVICPDSGWCGSHTEEYNNGN